jgi:hypothetical protein
MVVVNESRFRTWLLVVLLVGGALAIAMDVADLQSPARTAVVLTFVIVGPPLAIGALLRGVEPLARVVLAVSASLVVLTLTAMIMLAGGFWSPTGGLVAVATLTTVCAVAQWPPVSRRVRAGADALGRRADRLVVKDRPLTDEGTSPGAA